jgi:hypothetical protein
VTDEQLEAFSIKTGKQRMDSHAAGLQYSSDGAGATFGDRLAARVADALGRRPAALFRVVCSLSEGTCRAIRLSAEEGRDAFKRQRIGEDMRRLLKELEARYSDEPVYHVLARVFVEHFRLEAETLQVKEGEELSASAIAG